MRQRFAPRAALVLVLGAAAACATVPAIPPAPVAAAAPAAASDLAAALARAGHADAPTLAALQQTFGPADMERREGAGAILTYRLDACSLVLVFTADSRNEFRLAEASAQPARTDEPTPALTACADAARARMGS
jgi:hypothetical protein